MNEIERHAPDNKDASTTQPPLREMGIRRQRPSWEIPEDAPWEPIDNFFQRTESRREGNLNLDRSAIAELMTSSNAPARRNRLAEGRADAGGFSVLDRNKPAQKKIIPQRPVF